MKKLAKNILQLFLFWGVYSQTALSQDYTYRNYRTSDGLPSSEVYHAIQDKDGYIWFATDNGVSRFDGYQFMNFDMNDGLANNTVFDLYQDYKGRIWFIPLSGHLCYYENQKIVKYKYNHLIDKLLGVKAIPVKRSFYVDSLDNIFLPIGDYGLFKISPEGNVTELIGKTSDPTISIQKTGNESYSMSCKNVGKSAHGITINGNIKTFNYEVIPHSSSLLFATEGNSPDEIIFTINKSVFRYKNDSINKLTKFKNDIIWFSKDNLNNYWLSIRNQGIKLYIVSNNAQIDYIDFLEKEDVSSVLVDRENAVWFTTLDNGVYYLPSKEIKTLTITGVENKHVNSIGITPTKIYLGVDKQTILRYDKNTLKEDFRQKLPIQKSPNHLTYHPVLHEVIAGSYLSCLSVGTETNPMIGKNIVPNEPLARTDLAVKSMAVGNGNHYWAGTYTGLLKYEKNRITYISNVDDFWTESVYSIIENQDKSLWLGTFNGLWKYENGKYQNFGEKNELLTHRINALYKKNNTMFIGTKGVGLIIFDLIDYTTKVINTGNGLVSNSISSIVSYKNEIWIGTNKGMNRLTPVNNSFIISRLDIGAGLINNEINQLAVDDSILYVATRGGLNYINLNRLNQANEKPQLHIQRLKINNKDTSILSNYNLKFNQNNISISYVALAYKSRNNVRYKYQLLPIENDWQETDFHEINYANLSSGNYRFKIKAINESGVWSDVNESISFSIDKPFWKKWWFYLLPLTTIILIVLLLFQNTIYNIKKENRLRTELRSYTQKAIAAQINPHFIFNSFNSINHSILKNDKIESSRYLSKLSGYIRAVLDAVQKDFLTLSDELNIINLYLELEKFRLKEKLNYEIFLDKKINSKKINIPCLFIQPLLEKAIWTRLNLVKENGFIKISILKINQNIQVNIEDNGHVVENDTDNIDNDFISKRIQLLNDLYRGQIKFGFTPNTQVSFNQTGNIVQLILELNSN